MGHVLGALAAYRILVAEDDDDFLAALAALLEGDGRFAIAGRASTGCEAVELARELEIRAAGAVDYVRKSRVTEDLIEALMAAIE